jgi:hypothetical protein
MTHRRTAVEEAAAGGRPFGARALGLAAVVLGIWMTGCTSTVNRAGLEQLVATTSKDTRGAVYYQGRKSGHDHFRLQWNVGTRHIRVPVAESPVTNAFPFTADRQVWRGAVFMHLTGTALSSALAERLNASPLRVQ